MNVLTGSREDERFSQVALPAFLFHAGTIQFSVFKVNIAENFASG